MPNDEVEKPDESKSEQKPVETRVNRGLVIAAYREFTRPGFDEDPYRRYQREHGGRCSGGGGAC